MLKETVSQNVKILELPRIALIETNFHDMDAGWTRYVFDTYNIPFKVVQPGEVKETDLTNFDVIVFPDNDKNVLLEGKSKNKGGDCENDCFF